MAIGDGRPRETAGMSAGPKAGDDYRASSLPYLELAACHVEAMKAIGLYIISRQSEVQQSSNSGQI